MGTTPATRRRGAALEDALLDAAWAELTDRGYESLSPESVAERAGTSKSVVYRRWPSKGELVRAALLHIAGRDRDPVTVPDTGSLRGDVIALLRQVNERRLALALALIAQLGDLHRATGTSIDDLRVTLSAGQRSAMQEIVDRAAIRGEIDPSRLTPRIVRLPEDLFRHELLMTSRAVPDVDIVEIVDTIFLPLVLS
ncbi:TetR/AcrR family transcriptional regulator [Actinoplanes derwentensis]|uniref:DNA-binding transcriptional regulator, AcrR family n=1 Tax=Actinoplanes derwentensis TaxID=113562 RepID=A0A1H1WCD1_9ACTN|nr:TetR/AcrR family transcriptional regulator [Actinoplanes derwentensis]GID87384.1 TetR family transcriptional regulator [Actinoplanes derwentensis]SDS94745.1 DNA-binding transcriptional regulator, AcrR family [Actinoplanes derwentensis]